MRRLSTTQAKRLQKMAQAKVRLEQFKIDQIIPLIRCNRKARVQLCEQSVPVNSLSLRCFRAHGTNCARCGIKGIYFLLERDARENRFSLRLYAQSESGVEIPMTVDHIKPKSKGGKDNLNNLQPLCYLCNQVKKDTEQKWNSHRIKKVENHETAIN